MTTIDQIKAECHRAIELDRAAFKGPWQAEGTLAVNNDYNMVAQSTSDGNLRQICHSRTFSPAAARALLAAIKIVEDFEEMSSIEKGTSNLAWEICNKWEGRK